MPAASKLVKLGFVFSLAVAELLSACSRPGDDNAGTSPAASAASNVSSPTRAAIPDETIIRKIDALFVSEFKRFDITIASEKGEVTLGGFALNKKQADRALALARTVEGVGTVTDHISLYPLGYILQ
jgi:hypothetical protein